MQMENNKKSFGYLVGPLILYWLVNLVAVTAAEAVVLLGYMAETQAKKMGMDQIQQYVMDHMNELLQVINSRLVEISAFGALITLAVSAAFFLHDRKKEKLEGAVTTERASAGRYLWILLLGVGMCIALNNLMNLAGLAFYSDAYQKTSQAMYSAGFEVQILCLGILMPLSEEMIFRGVIFKRYEQGFGFKKAMLMSAMFFAVTHGNLVQIVYGFVMGLFLAYVYEKYGSLKAAASLHITMNLVSLFVTKVDGFTWMFSGFWPLCISTVGAAFVSACAFVKIRDINTNETAEGSEGVGTGF